MAKKVEFNREIVKKYLFWACAPIGLVVAVLAGWMAIGSIANELNTKKQELENQKSAMSQLRSGAATHPNQGTIDAIKEEQGKLATNVFTAWETLVQEQRKRNLWTGLADVAQQEIHSKNFLDPLSTTTLNNYLQFARDEMNKILDKSDIRRVQHYKQDGQPVEVILLTEGKSGTTTGSGKATSGNAKPVVVGPTTLKGKVVWGSPELDVTMKDWRQQPRPFEVWLTQEDLWVYQALLWVVAESNKDVREASKIVMSGTSSSGTSSSGSSGSGMRTGGDPLNLRDSVVKEIIDLMIGIKAAIELDKQSRRRISSGLGTGSEYGSGSSSGSSEGGLGLGLGLGGTSSSSGSSSDGSGGMALTGAAAAEAAKQIALTGRYVDAEGTPLMTPDFTGQFRRMPVYLQLRVDQRYISDVLVNCANCPMPIDVLWVTVSPDATQSFNYAPISVTGTGSSGYSGSPSESSVGRRSSSGAGSSRSSTMGRSGGGSRVATGDIDFGPNEVTIEIYGCINIFAPPEKEKLGGETGT